MNSSVSGQWSEDIKQRDLKRLQKSYGCWGRALGPPAADFGTWKREMEDTSKLAGEKVLLVEDDRSVRRVLTLTLEGAGFRTAEATDGSEALQLLEDKSIKAVVLDIGLPDGLESVVLEQLRQLSLRYGYPVWVVVSALDQEEATRRYGPCNGTFLAKPFDPWVLVKTLEELLSAKSQEPGQKQLKRHRPR